MKCTSVASRVQGTTGLPCSSLPWWLRMMWSTSLLGVGGEALDLLDLAAHPVVAERDLAEQLAGVGQLDRAVAGSVGLDLADVVQQRAGDRHVAVDAREGGGQRAHALGHRQAVLEQPVPVGLVVVLGRGGLVVAAPDSESSVEQARRAARAGAVAGRCRPALRGRPPSGRTGPAGPRSRSARLVLASARRRACARTVMRRAVALVDREAAERRGRRAPGGRLGASSSTPSQITASTAPVTSPSWSFRKASPLRFWRRARRPHDEDAIDLLAVREVADEAAWRG